jgi:O-antigen/teichoic acid export membrane protein
MVRRLLAFSIPLGINSAAFWLLNSLNRVLVTLCLGSEANGYYAVAMKFTQILVFVSTCFQFAWQELSFSKGFGGDEEGSRYYSEKTDLFLRVFMSALLLLIPAIRVGLWIFPQFIHASYAPAVALLPLAFFGAFLSVFSSFLDPIFGAAEKTGLILGSTLAGAVVNVALVLTLFHLGVGVEAANIAFLSGWAVTVSIRLVVLCRGARLQLRFGRLLWFLPLSAGVVVAFWYLPPVWNMLVLVGMLPIACAVLWPELRLICRALTAKRDQ